MGLVAGMSALIVGDYDEGAIKERLMAVAPDCRVLFAAACAELIFPAYRHFVQTTGTGDEPALRAALDLAWRVSHEAPVTPAQVDSQRETAEALVPHDDDDSWSELSPLAQNAAAAVTYALRAWLSADAQDGVWAARQVYELADFIAQVDSPALEYVRADTNSAVVLLVGGIASALAGCDSGNPSLLRSQSEEGGRRLVELIDGGDGP